MKIDVEYRNILVPIDFTDTSRLAFYVALRHSRMHDAATWVIHITEPLASTDGPDAMEHTSEELERIENGVRRRINELFEEGGLKEVDRRKVHVEFKAGDVATEILRAVVEHDIDLVVMGHNPDQRKGLRKLLSSSPSERIIERAPCHVLTVKPLDYTYVPDAIPEKPARD